MLLNNKFSFDFFLDEQKSPDYLSVNNSIIPKSMDNSPSNTEFLTHPKTDINILNEPKKKEISCNNNKEQVQNTKLIPENCKKPPLNPSSPKKFKDKEKKETLTLSLPSTISKNPTNHKKSRSIYLFDNNFEEIPSCDTAKSLDSKKITTSQSNAQLIHLTKQSNESSEANSFEKKEYKNSQIDKNSIKMDPSYKMKPMHNCSTGSSMKITTISEQFMVLIGDLIF